MRADLTGPDGRPAPDDAIELSVTTLTALAGGEATVTVTSRTAHDGPDGAYSGRVIASAGESDRIVTPIGVDREIESYSLRLESIDHAGDPAPVDVGVFGLDAEIFEFVYDEDGSAELRRPKGRDTLDAIVLGPSLLVQPVLDLDRDTTWTADARQAKPMVQSVPDAAMTSAQVSFWYHVNVGYGWAAGSPSPASTTRTARMNWTASSAISNHSRQDSGRDARLHEPCTSVKPLRTRP